MRRWGLTPPQWRELPEDDRDEMLEEHAAYCPSCGNLREVCSDPTREWYPQRSMCYPTAVRELVRRQVQEKHKKPEPGVLGLHPLDGMSIWVSEFDLTPDDDFNAVLSHVQHAERDENGAQQDDARDSQN